MYSQLCQLLQGWETASGWAGSIWEQREETRDGAGQSDQPVLVPVQPGRARGAGNSSSSPVSRDGSEGLALAVAFQGSRNKGNVVPELCAIAMGLCFPLSTERLAEVRLS